MRSKIRRLPALLISRMLIFGIMSSTVVFAEEANLNSQLYSEEYNGESYKDDTQEAENKATIIKNVKIAVQCTRNPDDNRVKAAFLNVGNATGEFNGTLKLWHQMKNPITHSYTPVLLGEGRVSNEILGPNVSCSKIFVPNNQVLPVSSVTYSLNVKVYGGTKVFSHEGSVTPIDQKF